MITELNVNGKKRIAIVFNEVYDLGTIGDIRRGVMGALNAISLSEEAKNALSCQELYSLNAFLSLTEPTEFYEVPLMCFDDKE